MVGAWLFGGCLVTVIAVCQVTVAIHAVKRVTAEFRKIRPCNGICIFPGPVAVAIEIVAGPL